MVVIIALNCFPVRIYGETEVWFASPKVFTILGLLSLTVVLFFGGGPTHEPLWCQIWFYPGPVNEYLGSGEDGRRCAFIGVTTISFYAFAFAPEMLAVTGGEKESPRRSLPTATLRSFHRIVLFYVLGAFEIGTICNNQNKELLGGGLGAGPSIEVLPDIINATVLISAWSAGNSYLYLSSCQLYTMAVAGSAPAIIKRRTTSGMPYMTTWASILWAFSACLIISDLVATMFRWFGNIHEQGSTAPLTAHNSRSHQHRWLPGWICCCIIYLRFRKAADAQGLTNPVSSRVLPGSAALAPSRSCY